MTLFAQRNRIGGAASFGLPAFQMADVQRNICPPAVETSVTFSQEFRADPA